MYKNFILKVTEHSFDENCEISLIDQNFMKDGAIAVKHGRSIHIRKYVILLYWRNKGSTENNLFVNSVLNFIIEH